MQKNISLHIEEDYKGLSTLAANIFAQAVHSMPKGVYGFATGGTPEGMYKELVEMVKVGNLDMSQITAFNLDEYVPILPDNTQSYSYYMATKLFDAVGVTNRNIPSGNALDNSHECIMYEKKIADCGGIDLQILGIGTNGHIGFNEPSDIFSCDTGYVELTQSTIDANARFFENSEQVPKHAISMGMKTIMMAEKLMLLASGESKAKILHDALTGPITPKVPASVLQLHRNVIVIADKAAATYFK